MDNKLPDKILFVDIDGCLTSIDTGTYFSIDLMKYGPSKIIVNKVKQFCKDNDAKIVISSNWRKFEPDGEWKNSYGTFKNPLNKTIEMLGDYCIGTLPTVRHVKKSEALILWLEENDYKGKFAIFDDDLKENYQSTYDYDICKSFIYVDNEYGITDQNLEKAKEFLER